MMNKAFTMIELMVSVAILIIIATFAVIDVTTSRSGLVLEKGRGELRSYLLYSRNLAVTGKVFLDEEPDGDLDVPYGYGVNFPLTPYAVTKANLATDSYRMYGDLYAGASSGNGYFEAGELLGDASLQNSGDAIGFEIQYGDPPTTAPVPFSIFFETTTGDIAFYENTSELNTPFIYVQVYNKDSPSVSKTIYINKDTWEIYELED